MVRTRKTYRNYELMLERCHQKPAGNSGVFIRVTPASIGNLATAGKPSLPDGVEIQILDHAINGEVRLWVNGGKSPAAPPASPPTATFASEAKVHPSISATCGFAIRPNNQRCFSITPGNRRAEAHRGRSQVCRPVAGEP